MLKKIALVGLFATISIISTRTPPPRTAPRDPRPTEVESPRMRGGPCLPGLPRC